ncbi:MAG: ribosome biogenesis GTPase YlqF [Clostridia bacterium]|nr:ribosome biogenesis GTPase YlqF [Clostridia bacterium]
MPTENIQWFPGHMAKTRRMISENLKNVDIIIEILDARIPFSSRNPEIAKLTAQKPRLILLNKADLADPSQNRIWMKSFQTESSKSILTNCSTGQGFKEIPAAIREILSEKISRYEARGMGGRKLFAMVLGIPNVGKSTFINRISKTKNAKAEDRPGVTKTKQWISTTLGIDFLDMPGILWPRFDNQTIGENLALTGAIKDESQDLLHLGIVLCKRLRTLYPDALAARYKFDNPGQFEGLTDYELFLQIGKKRGFLISRGEINEERTANVLLDEFRNAKIGLMTLDRLPEESR